MTAQATLVGLLMRAQFLIPCLCLIILVFSHLGMQVLCAGKSILVAGSISPWLEAIAKAFGATCSLPVVV